MPPRRQPPPASGPWGPRPAVLLLAPLLLLLALQGVAAAPVGAEGPEDSPGLQDAEFPSGLLQQAARAALHFFNFRAGSPSALRVLAAVLEGRATVSARVTRRLSAWAGHLCARARPPRGVRRWGRWGQGLGGSGVVRPCGGPWLRRVHREPAGSFAVSEAVDFSQGSSHSWERGAWGN